MTALHEPDGLARDEVMDVEVPADAGAVRLAALETGGIRLTISGPRSQWLTPEQASELMTFLGDAGIVDRTPAVALDLRQLASRYTRTARMAAEDGRPVHEVAETMTAAELRRVADGLAAS